MCLVPSWGEPFFSLEVGACNGLGGGVRREVNRAKMIYSQIVFSCGTRNQDEAGVSRKFPP
jgi:hypothetical protein